MSMVIVVIRNFGVVMSDSVLRLIMWLIIDLCLIVVRMLSSNVIGIDMVVVIVVSVSDFGRCLLISFDIGMLLDSEWLKLLCSSLLS